MSIQVKQNIEPIPVKEFGDAKPEDKYKMTKIIGKNGADDIYNFYGKYDLAEFFEDTSDVQPQERKNLCLCISKKR
jgi:hypothetical protein